MQYTGIVKRDGTLDDEAPEARRMAVRLALLVYMGLFVPIRRATP